MSNYQFANSGMPTTADMSVDAGLRSFMLGVFNKMALGLLLSGALAYVAATVEPIRNLVFFSPLYFVVAFGPLAILLISSFVMRNPSPAASGIIYWSVVSLIGTGMGALLIRYAGFGSAYDPQGMYMITKAFLVTSAAFGGLALWGYTTKKDLTGFGTFLIMGLIGIIIAGVVNFFLKSPMMHFIISVAGVGIFAGLTAYDTQRLKFTYYQLGGDQRGMAVATNYGALSLYLDFVNLFQFILALMGSGDD